MPELPEVETVRRTLKRQILNEKIKDVKVYWDNIIGYPNVNEFTRNIKKQIIVDIKRRGKWLIFELNDYYLICHLRMEGKFFLKKQGEPLEKHEHIVIIFDTFELRFKDVRKFGRMYLYKKEDIEKAKPLQDLGLEPFDSELTVAYLKQKYKNKRIPVKTALLDQTIIAGIGNIYADEILFLANINPLKRVNKLTKKDLELIIENTRKVLDRAIELGGTTIRTYTSSLGVTGKFQKELCVHQRKGEKCKVCGNLIEKIKVGGRGTYYCPKCQKK